MTPLVHVDNALILCLELGIVCVHTFSVMPGQDRQGVDPATIMEGVCIQSAKNLDDQMKILVRRWGGWGSLGGG